MYIFFFDIKLQVTRTKTSNHLSGRCKKSGAPFVGREGWEMDEEVAPQQKGGGGWTKNPPMAPGWGIKFILG